MCAVRRPAQSGNKIVPASSPSTGCDRQVSPISITNVKPSANSCARSGDRHNQGIRSYRRPRRVRDVTAIMIVPASSPSMRCDRQVSTVLCNKNEAFWLGSVLGLETGTIEKEWHNHSKTGLGQLTCPSPSPLPPHNPHYLARLLSSSSLSFQFAGRGAPERIALIATLSESYCTRTPCASLT